jgi:epoxyqueuosine reductase
VSTDKGSSSVNRLRRSDLESWLPTFLQSRELPSHRFGIAKLEKPVSIKLYDTWLASGHHGEMTYLERHRDFKADPTQWLAFAKSALVFAIEYVPRKESNYVTPASALRTALYTRYAPKQADYHVAIRRELEPVLRELESRFPGAHFRLSIDAEPVLERDLAVRAGLGWVGKNTCVIDRQGGSLFFIAEILTSLDTDAALIEVTDFCGRCTRCLDACPTQALVSPQILDATKCISYWTIESKTVPPKELRSKFGDWFYGCDICQTVCPWNEKVFGRERMQHDAKPVTTEDHDRLRLATELEEILVSSNRELLRRFLGTPLARARAFGLKRNALVIAANLKLASLGPAIEKLFDDEKLGRLARETYAEINS